MTAARTEHKPVGGLGRCLLRPERLAARSLPLVEDTHLIALEQYP